MEHLPMRRLATIVGIVLPVLLIAGFALAGSGSSSDDTTTTTIDDTSTTTIDEATTTTIDDTSTTTIDEATTTTIDAEPDENSEPGTLTEGEDIELVDGDRMEFELTEGTFTFIVDEAGSVTLMIGSLQFVQATPNEFWDFRVKHADSERVEVRFRQGDAHFDFKARIHHGLLQVRVQRNGADLPTDPTALPAFTTEIFSAADAGTVTINVSSEMLQLVTVSPNEDWEFEIDDARNDRVRVEFNRGDDRVRFRFELGSAEPEVRSD